MVLHLIVIINIYYSEGECIVDELDLKRFKKIISLLETSGGRNLNHEPIKTGIHKNSVAIGDYGLMPLTIKEMAQRRLRDGQGDELDKRIASLSNEEAKKVVPQLVKNRTPEYERYADALGSKVLKNYGDLEKAAVAWNQGHNLPMDRVEELINNPKTEHQANYRPRFRRAMDTVSKQGIADKAFATTRGVMELDPEKSDFVKISDVDLGQKLPEISIPVDRTPAEFIAPSDEEEPTGTPSFSRLLEKLVDPNSISYKKKKQQVEEDEE